MAKLTTTSFFILGMLASRDFSAYELAEQIAKGVTEVWPRADRQLYNAPKILVGQGLATSRAEYTGRRRRTVYSITDDGRDALRQWLAGPVAPASLEFPGMIRLLFADQGSLEDLRSTLEAIRRQAEGRLELFQSHLEFMQETGGSYPERQHLMVLANRFMQGHFAHLAEWATWALRETESWTGTTADGAGP